MFRTIVSTFAAVCAACTAPAVGLGETYQYWQVTIDANGSVSPPERLPAVKADHPPSKESPVDVRVKTSPTAAAYRILRVPAHAPSAPTVEVVNRGHDTFYYWLVAHVGLLRSPIAGPARAENCDAGNLRNIVRWEKTSPYTQYTVLRTRTPQVPSGELNILCLWGIHGHKKSQSPADDWEAHTPQRVLVELFCFAWQYRTSESFHGLLKFGAGFHFYGGVKSWPSLARAAEWISTSRSSSSATV